MKNTSVSRPDFRPLSKGMGQAVAERTYLRPLLTEQTKSLIDPGKVRISSKDPHFRKWITALHNTTGYTPVRDDNAPMRGMAPDTRWETWGELADRVALGNTSILGGENMVPERIALRNHIANAVILMSGRHLQHGDSSQSFRNMEVFSNCSTAPTSFALFYLLLNGSGVGRSYDDDMMLVDWDNMPTLRVVISNEHPDFDYSQHTSVRDAKHLYGKSRNVHWLEVQDSREGWAQAVEQLEIMTYQRTYRDDTLVLDFSSVRGKNQPIMGMQGRPSSGPEPLMNALEKIAKIKGAKLPLWLQTMFVDQFLAEPVLVGGARRAARMSTKHWSDAGILDFIEVKRPIEYEGMSMDGVIDYRSSCGPYPPTSFLWSSNNSVTVDEDFWRRVAILPGEVEYKAPLSRRARKVFERLCECAYGDGTGEPGIINTHLLTKNDDGLEADVFKMGRFMKSDRYTVTDETHLYLMKLYKAARKKTNNYIVNPCGEIVLHVLGAFCVICDLVPFFADTFDEVFDAARHGVRSMIRVNTMDSLYQAEVQRTNRIGIGQTGIHEFAWKFFNIGFRDLVNPDFEGLNALHGPTAAIGAGSVDNDPRIRSAAFWSTQGALSRAVHEESVAYATSLGMVAPHTDTTMKPSGSVSKLFLLTEGAHLPSMEFFMRWVQFRSDDPQIEGYREKGYPVRELTTYRGHVIVGFPTAPAIAELGMGDKLVTAADASMDDQYKWLKLLEAFWIEGTDVQSYVECKTGPLPAHGNQVSYTMKYRPEVTDYKTFKLAVLEHQSAVRCVSVMPQGDMSAYEYLPESPVSKAEYEAIVAAIKISAGGVDVAEDVGREHLDCAGGACPISWVEEKGEG